MTFLRGSLRIACTTCTIAASCGCSNELPPQGQVLLFVDTDAPVLDPDAPDGAIPLFDTLRIDVMRPGETEPCTGCTRQFAVNASAFRDVNVSAGLVTDTGTPGFVARLRLFCAAATASTEPDAASALETTVELPVIEDEGIVEVTAFLATETVGHSPGTAARPEAPVPGRPAVSRVGSWALSERTACSHAPRDGEVCIPGGAFWMGDPRLTTTLMDEGTESDLQRIVRLDPFFLGISEVTVAMFRASGLADADPDTGASADPTEWTGRPGGQDYRDYCTYTTAAGPRDNLPVNCVSWEKADQYCKSLGGELPTEAMFEYASGALRGSPRVWGSEAPACDDAVHARAGQYLFGSLGLPNLCGGIEGGAAEIGSGRRDKLDVGGVQVIDLAGNVSEWMRDLWNRQDEPCWGAGVFRNPACGTPSAKDPGNIRSVRGGNWIFPEVATRAALRFHFSVIIGGHAAALGFRCVRQDLP